MITAQGAKALFIEQIDKTENLDLVISRLCDQIAFQAECGYLSWQYYDNSVWGIRWFPITYRLKCLGYGVVKVDEHTILISWENPSC